MIATLAMTNNSLTVEQRYWFVVFCTVFPILVLLVFFLIVWNRPTNFYSPRDFSDEHIYLKLMKQGKMEDEVNEVIESETIPGSSSRMVITSKIASAETRAIDALREEFKTTVDRQVVSHDRSFLYDAVINQKEGPIYVEVKYVNEGFFSQKTLENIKLFSEEGHKKRKLLAIVTPKELNEAEKDRYINTIARIGKDIELRFYTYQNVGNEK